MLKKAGSGKVSELKIDKDCFVDQEWMDYHIKLIVCECKKHGIIVKSIKKCNSKHKGYHLYIKIKPAIDANFANSLQWLFGDDARRVGFNRARIESGLLEWNKLFEIPCRRLRTIYRGDRDVSHEMPE